MYDKKAARIRHTDNSRSSAPDIAVPRQAFCYLSRSNRGQNSRYRGHIAVIILDITVKSRSKFLEVLHLRLTMVSESGFLGPKNLAIVILRSRQTNIKF